jgi:CubicO group peptidase (beta-lactamase class C family)
MVRPPAIAPKPIGRRIDHTAPRAVRRGMIGGMDERDKAQQVGSDIRLDWTMEGEPPRRLARLMERLRIPGVSLAVISEGSLAWAHTWGVR